MKQMSIKELEDTLRSGEREELDSDRLATIRQSGGRRGARQRALTGLGAAVLVGMVGLTLAITATGDERTNDDTSVADDPREQQAPKELSPLARRALAEIPGAVQVSEWQVVLPSPDAESSYWAGGLPPGFHIVGATVPMGSDNYHGVTMFPAHAWPEWLYQGTLDYEQSQKDENGSYEVGSVSSGILVDVGEAELACASVKDAPCGPVVMTRKADGDLRYEGAMGNEEFLTPGSDMQVFVDEDDGTEAAGTRAIAGLPGTDVARVEFVTTAGEVVEGQVSTTLVEGASMMWAQVPGSLEKVVAYDASGEVIEDHPLNQCDSPVECEVR